MKKLGEFAKVKLPEFSEKVRKISQVLQASSVVVVVGGGGVSGGGGGGGGWCFPGVIPSYVNVL